MHLTGMKFVLAAVITFCLAVPASAQLRGVDAEGGRDRQPSVRRKAQRAMPGTVTDIRVTRSRDGQEGRVVARVETKRGRTLLIDLGPVDEVRDRLEGLREDGADMGVGRGALRGDQPRKVDRRGPFADERSAAGEFGPPRRDRQRDSHGLMGPDRNVRREDRDPHRHRAHDGLPPHVEISGRVLDDVATVTLEGFDGPRRLVTLEASNGQTHRVELGTPDQTKDIQVQKGEMLTVIGQRRRINGEPFIVANHVSQLVTINRSEERRARAERMEEAGQENSPQNVRWHRDGVGTELPAASADVPPAEPAVQDQGTTSAL